MNVKKNKSTYILAKAKKLRAIEYKGGKCEICGNKHIDHLSFHHLDPTQKEGNLSTFVLGRWSNVVKEIDKCVLVCHNCHRGLHEHENDRMGRCYINKLTFLIYKNTKCCIKCGYSKLNTALEFHHVNSEDKSLDFWTIRQRINAVKNIPLYVKEELDKCDVLCANCHSTEHFNSERYVLLENEIKEKIETMKEQQPKIDRQEVANLYSSGMMQKDIAKKFNASKGTICDIIKKLKQAAFV